jgi:predicted nucleic acid-binding protein
VQDRTDVVVFDTGPLSHFALAGWLGLLKAVVDGRAAVVPDVVAAELRAGAVRDSRIAAVLDEPWIQIRELTHFAHFSSLLVKRDRNIGEAGVLALAKATDAMAIIDDGAARKAAADSNIRSAAPSGSSSTSCTPAT